MPPKDNWLVINKVQLALCVLGSWLLSFQCGGLRTVPLGFIRRDGALFRGLQKGSTSKTSADPPTDVGEVTQTSRAGKQMLHSNSRSRRGKRSPPPPMQGGAESRRDPVLRRATPGQAGRPPNIATLLPPQHPSVAPMLVEGSSNSLPRFLGLLCSKEVWQSQFPEICQERWRGKASSASGVLWGGSVQRSAHSSWEQPSVVATLPLFYL